MWKFLLNLNWSYHLTMYLMHRKFWHKQSVCKVYTSVDAAISKSEIILGVINYLLSLGKLPAVILDSQSMGRKEARAHLKVFWKVFTAANQLADIAGCSACQKQLDDGLLQKLSNKTSTAALIFNMILCGPRIITMHWLYRQMNRLIGEEKHNSLQKYRDIGCSSITHWGVCPTESNRAYFWVSLSIALSC